MTHYLLVAAFFVVVHAALHEVVIDTNFMLAFIPPAIAIIAGKLAKPALPTKEQTPADVGGVSALILVAGLAIGKNFGNYDLIEILAGMVVFGGYAGICVSVFLRSEQDKFWSRPQFEETPRPEPARSPAPEPTIRIIPPLEEWVSYEIEYLRGQHGAGGYGRTPQGYTLRFVDADGKQRRSDWDRQSDAESIAQSDFRSRGGRGQLTWERTSDNQGTLVVQIFFRASGKIVTPARFVA